MTGLDKILAGIAADAKAEADAALAAARQKADELRAAQQAETAKSVQAIEAEGARTAMEIDRASDSALQLQRRQRTLEAKQALLEETLQRALENLRALPDAEYFALLLKLAAQNAEQGEGLMLLSERDKARLPASFEASLAAALPAGAALKVAGATRPIDGGFVLKYGDIEQNCSFAAILDARREEFADAVTGILFA